MAIKRIPIVSGIDAEESMEGIGYGSDSTNIMFDKYLDGTLYATQRPGWAVIGDPSDYSLDSSGRGIYYWSRASSFYTVTNDIISAGYGLPIQTISEGRDRVYFAEVGSYLVITDPENNEGWYIHISDPVTVMSIDDANFPPNQGGQVQIVPGLVSLDGFVFVMDSDGIIWQSNYLDPTTWTLIDSITAEREADGGVYLAKHHDQVVAIGAESIEFFYNAGNAEGSVLARRQDVSYKTGGVGGNSVYFSGDSIFFLGIEKNGSIGLYAIENFSLRKVSSMAMDRMFVNLGIESNYEYILTVAMVNDHHLVFLTGALAATGGNDEAIWDSQVTYVFDSSAGLWTKFQYNGKALTGFPVIDIADRTQSNIRTATYMLATGDLMVSTNSLEPQDEITSTSYFAEDYLVDNDDYVEPGAAGGSTNISIEIITPVEDFDTTTYKYGHYLSVIGTKIKDGGGATGIGVSWSDDHYTTWSTERSISTNMVRKLTRLGNFKRRAHKLTYSGADSLRIEGLELELRGSRYA